MSNKNIATFLQMFMILLRNSAFDNKVEEEILEQKRWCLDTTKTLHINWLDKKTNTKVPLPIQYSILFLFFLSFIEV